MAEHDPMLAEALRKIAARDPAPPAWSDSGNLPWDEPSFSERMLRVHLDETQQAATRPEPQRTRIIDWLVEHLPLPEQTFLLDLTCGPGLYALELARRGVSVTGIDFSPAAISHAQRTGAVHRLDDRASFVLADVRKANLGRSAFDAAMMLYGQLTVFKPEETRDLLARIRQALVPGGAFAFEIRDPERIERTPQTWWRIPAKSIWSDEPHVDFGEQYFDEQAHATVQRHHILHLDSGALDVVSVCDQVYTRDEMTAMLTDAGFSEIEAFPAWDGLDLPDAEDWLVYIARVPSQQ